MEVFEVTNNPLWVSPALPGWGKPFFSGKFCSGGVAPLWLLAGIHKKGWSPPIEGKAHT